MKTIRLANLGIEGEWVRVWFERAGAGTVVGEAVVVGGGEALVLF
jgi:hypothetical protein